MLYGHRQETVELGDPNNEDDALSHATGDPRHCSLDEECFKCGEKGCANCLDCILIGDDDATVLCADCRVKRNG